MIGRGIRQDAATALSRIYYNGTKFTLNGNSGTLVSALIGSGGTAVNQIKNGGLRIDTAGFTGIIARGLADFPGDTGTLTKEGLGTLTLTAANTFTGATTVSGGTLAFSRAGNVAANTVITVAGGATLSFNRNDTFGTIQKSSNLGRTDPWTDVAPVTNDPTTISYQLVPGPGPALFIRLSVTQIRP